MLTGLLNSNLETKGKNEMTAKVIDFVSFAIDDKNSQDAQARNLACALASDIVLNLDESDNCNYVDKLVPHLLGNLSAHEFNFESKIFALTSIGEILMTAGTACSLYIEKIMQLLSSVSEMSLK